MGSNLSKTRLAFGSVIYGPFDFTSIWVYSCDSIWEPLICGSDSEAFSSLNELLPGVYFKIPNGKAKKGQDAYLVYDPYAIRNAPEF